MIARRMAMVTLLFACGTTEPQEVVRKAPPAPSSVSSVPNVSARRTLAYPVGAFAVAEPRLDRWELHAFDGGWQFGVVGGRAPYSTFDIKTSCGGVCVHAQLAEQFVRGAQQLHDSVEAPCTARWVRPPSELRPGVLAYNLAFEGGGRCRQTHVEVAHIDERARDMYLSCGASLYGDDVALAPGVAELCANLKFEVGLADDPLGTIFAHRFSMLGDPVSVPSLDGWRFERWNGYNGFELGEVWLASSAGSKAQIGRIACKGCDEAARLAHMVEMRQRALAGGAPIELREGLWMERRGDVLFGAAVSPKKSGFLTCEASLRQEDSAQMDRVEAYCRSVLVSWRDA